jgi:hypothetical protein
MNDNERIIKLQNLVGISCHVKELANLQTVLDGQIRKQQSFHGSSMSSTEKQQLVQVLSKAFIGLETKLCKCICREDE